MSAPRTLALTLKHQALIKSSVPGESVIPCVIAALDEFIEFSKTIEATNADLLAALEEIAGRAEGNAKIQSGVGNADSSMAWAHMATKARAALSKARP